MAGGVCTDTVLLNYVERMFDSEEIVEIYGRAVYVFGTYMDTPDINEKILFYKKQSN